MAASWSATSGTPASCSWREFFAFGVRQYRFVWIHRPCNFVIALVVLWAPPVCLALAAPDFAAGSPAAWIALLLVAALGEMETDAPILCLTTLPNGCVVADDGLGRLHWLEVVD